ncbi:adhesion protein FadA [Streptococcus infantis SK970]|nr:adhesion protein FadA [Streptococcus infantis SK970]
MKKTLLAIAITLSFLGFATNSAWAVENNLQTTSAEKTQETTTTEKEKRAPLQPRKLLLLLKQVQASLQHLLQLQVQVQTRKKRQKLQKSKRMVGYLKKISGASMKQTNLL